MLELERQRLCPASEARGVRALRIGMPTTSFPRDDTDPSGRFVLELAARLAERGHTVEVLAPEPSAAIAGPTLPRGVTLRWVPYLRPRSLARTFYGAGVLDNLSRDPLAWPGMLTHPLALARTMADAVGRWDAVVSHWVLPCGVVTSAVLRATGAELPHVAIAHSGDAHLLSRLPLRSSLGALLASRAHLVASSNATRALLRGPLPADRIDVLPMGTDEPPLRLGERDAARSSLGIDGFTVLSIARHVPVKRLDVVIDAAASLGDGHLVLAGDGPLRGELEARARARRLDARFLGVVGTEDRRRWLAAADVVVLASAPLSDGRTEGAPLAVSEALAAGVPVVASATGGIVDLVRHGVDGLLVPPDDPIALASALGRLRSEPGLHARLVEGASARGAPSMRATAARIEDALSSWRVPSPT